MAYQIDWYAHSKAEIDGIWVISRPIVPSLWFRIKDAWLVLIGKADAVTFYKQ
jgi:hypothetical protein